MVGIILNPYPSVFDVSPTPLLSASALERGEGGLSFHCNNLSELKLEIVKNIYFTIAYCLFPIACLN
ncbi:hypothetical protein Cyast_2677 [Cyanobacterium stanieri PCC 7202]|uniref:Uncharacterized protein n=1 Tax=Cyanobacterium stanieri (strain ATCC 29140 / PCC 7202) TaxID=292563 RepID=K9YQF3_CYASC|nr:hypothetical protein Cyast_2677 [Cyanobacterium stanieri PCC 7202]